MSSEGRSLWQAASLWMKEIGPSADVVISSRLRLARNISAIPFPTQLDRDRARQVLEVAEKVTEQLNELTEVPFRFFRLADYDALDHQVLLEKHLISPQLTQTPAVSGLILRDDDAISIMVNEEDHFRIQCLLPGLSLERAWSMADAVDTQMAESIDYAFDSDWGYLTTCPTNLGTGMRGSVMVHLPGLVLTGNLDSIVANLTKVGAVVRGHYGEGSEAEGDLFQLSNRVTLGHKEQDIQQDLLGIVTEVVRRERAAREYLLSHERMRLEDRVYRAYGLLTHSRVMSSEEAMALLSMLRLGVDLNVISGIPLTVFPDIMVRIQRGFLQQEGDAVLDPEARDLLRARVIRDHLTTSMQSKEQDEES